jgi:hypothetical protein
MKPRKFLTTLLLVVALLGCGKRQPRHIVILPDVSGSIDRQSLEQAFKAINELISHLHRRDRLTIIPILGDAEAEAPGRVMRFEVPRDRQAYDTDLRDFRAKLKVSLNEMQVNSLAHPASRTDILGSVELAAQEFESAPSKSTHVLVLLSDFIQEDRKLDFRKDDRLRNPLPAKASAAKLAKAGRIDFQGTRIYLALLRSNEYTSLCKERRDAIQEFWVEYFSLSHGQADSVTDGIGLIERLF